LIAGTSDGERAVKHEHRDAEHEHEREPEPGDPPKIASGRVGNGKSSRDLKTRDSESLPTFATQILVFGNLLASAMKGTKRSRTVDLIYGS
jgi:hypothetical protein